MVVVLFLYINNNIFFLSLEMAEMLINTGFSVIKCGENRRKMWRKMEKDVEKIGARCGEIR